MNSMGPWPQLDRWDQEWRSRLASVSLAAEIDADPLESGEALVNLAAAYRRSGDASADKARVLDQWPGCLVVGMAGAAADYKDGAYYKYLWKAAGYDGSATDDRLWGEAFLRALQRLGLPRFPDASLRFVGPILMHCGIPTDCLKDLLRMLVDHSKRDPGLDADSFVSWALGGPNRMNGLDKPVQHLIQDGSEYAYDIIDRLLDLLYRLRDPSPDLFGIGLPERLITETRRVKSAGLLGAITPPRGTARRSAVGLPRLTLDPFGEGPRILLPYSKDPWRVIVDDQPHDIRAARSWLDDEIGDVAFPLPHPVSHVQVRLLGRTGAVEIPVVITDDPLLTFGEDGELLPPGRPLPRDLVWVLFPEDRQLDAEGKIREVSEAFLPFGWEGWALLEVDLSDARFLGLAGGNRRGMRGSAGPRIMLPEPLPGITAAHRLPVYGAAPLICLPSDQPRTWFVEVRSSDQRPVAPVRVSARSGDIDPWQDMPRPVIGTFDVSILGPLGFGLRRRLIIAEGLTVTYEPDIRLLTANGLDPATAKLAGRAQVSEATIRFDEQEREKACGYGSARYVIAPPHLSVLHDDRTGRARWSAMPLRLSAEALTQRTAGILMVRAQAALTLPVLRATDGDVSQDVQPQGARHAGQARYPLAQLTHTVAAVHRLDLSLLIRGRSVPVAFVRPQALATGVTRSGNRIALTGCAWQPGLHAGIYAVYQPWREVTVLPVGSDGTVLLPADLRDVGPLRVFPAMQELDASWPYWPPSGDSFLAPSKPSEEALRNPMLAFLAEERRPCPEDMADEHSWLLMRLADELRTDGAQKGLRGQCEMRLRSYPVRALLALANTGLNTAEAVAELIRTGLADQPVIGSVDVDVARHLWGRLQVVAGLLSGGILANLEISGEFIDRIVHDHGGDLAKLLVGQTDPYDPAGPCSDRQVPGAEQLASDALAVLGTTPYRELADRIRARPDGSARASAALALAMRAAAASGGQQRYFRKKYRSLWGDLAQAEPDLVALDITAAQTAIAAIKRRTTMGK